MTITKIVVAVELEPTKREKQQDPLFPSKRLLFDGVRWEFSGLVFRRDIKFVAELQRLIDEYGK